MVLLLITSCTTIEQVRVAPKTNSSMLDYSQLTSKGVFVTESNSVSFDYETVGSIMVITTDGYINNVYNSPSYTALCNETLNLLAQKKANGIVNLKIEHRSQKREGTLYEIEHSIVLTGMAIKKTGSDSIRYNPKTTKRAIGSINGINIEVLEAYNNGMRLLTTSKLSTEQIRKAHTKFLSNQQMVQFYTAEGWTSKTAYAAIVDGKVFDYESNAEENIVD